MRTISHELIAETVKNMCIDANCFLPEETFTAFEQARVHESSPLGKSLLAQCVENAHIAQKNKMPICQDTGLAVFFIKMGTHVTLDHGLMYDAVNEGVRHGYREGYLRKSVLSDPLFDRTNTGDNTPAIIHLELVEGDTVEITMAPKGGGAENMSRIAMLTPSAGVDGVKKFVTETVINAGGNPCPPTVVGVGIGGSFERAAFLAKKALIYPLGKPNADARYDRLEKEILTIINNSGVGPQGLGGNVTSFNVHIEYEPCHLASLPVAVNINCHVHRHAHAVL